MTSLRLCPECGEEKDKEGFKEYVPVEIHEKLPGKQVTIIPTKLVCADCHEKLEAAETEG